jgi:predicted O-methyltransferase YrrM
VEPRAVPPETGFQAVGPFQTLGSVVWIGWVLAGVGAVALPGRVTRRLVLAALGLTVLVVPAAALTPYERPPLLVLAPQAALGLLALGWAPQPSWRSAAAALPATATAIAVAAVAAAEAPIYGYRTIERDVSLAVALALVVVAAGVGFARTVERDARGWWAVLLVLPPAALLSVEQIVLVTGDRTGLTVLTIPTRPTFVAVAVVLALVAALPLPVATFCATGGGPRTAACGSSRPVARVWSLGKPVEERCPRRYAPGPMSVDLPDGVVRATAVAGRAGFTMSCEPDTGALLAVLAAGVASGGRILELGTGAGVGTSWIVHGLAARNDVEVVTVDISEGTPGLVGPLGWPPFVRPVVGDAVEATRREGSFDLIFADAQGGKWYGLDVTIAALRPGGHLLVDDMSPPFADAEHERKTAEVRTAILGHPDLIGVPIAWSSGLILSTRCQA